MAGPDPILCVRGSIARDWGKESLRKKKSKTKVLKSSSTPRGADYVSPRPHRLPLESHRGWNEAKTSPVKLVALIKVSCLGLRAVSWFCSHS